MRKSQLKKRQESKRPVKKYYINYSSDGGTTRIEVTKEIREQWESYCRLLGGLPTKIQYIEFMNKL